MYRNIYIYYHSNSSLLGLGFAPATSNTNQTMSILGGSILFGCAPYDSLPSSLIPYHPLSNLGISCSKAIFWFLFGIPGSSNFGASHFDVLTASCDPLSSFSPWKNGKNQRFKELQKLLDRVLTDLDAEVIKSPHAFSGSSAVLALLLGWRKTVQMHWIRCQGERDVAYTIKQTYSEIPL